MNFLHNKMLNNSLATQLNLAYLGNRRHTYFIENISIYCFDRVQIAAILDFTGNAITKVRSGYTPMSDMLGNIMVHNQIMILLRTIL